MCPQGYHLQTVNFYNFGNFREFYDISVTGQGHTPHKPLSFVSFLNLVQSKQIDTWPMVPHHKL